MNNEKLLMIELSDVLENGEIITRKNSALDGDVRVKRGGLKITKDKRGHYVLTGYDNKQTKKEATESINAVIAQYGNSPEFLGIYAQVGAVIASYKILPDSYEKSSESNTHDHNILYKHAKIVVNGKERVCHTGLVNGFKSCVERLDNAVKLNQELVKENTKLRNIIERSNDNEISF